ncbi:hypothetical protein [Rhodopirellula sallentina]|uniref:Putative membrane protein n=1 Tax=Rhodopirellula sallentina SM41 TaxID=1263870 RepID=M5TZ15_9BACT|nr:hypothetical protein [Rhodopirellula sallentina]EMI54445.1 putative membrane protein [Rhodopirellula sallentina SM41]
MLGQDHNETAVWALSLTIVWCAGLLLQSVLTQILFSVGRPLRDLARRDLRPAMLGRRPEPVASTDDASGHSVTLTVGGVWVAVPSIQQSLRYQPSVDPYDLFVEDDGLGTGLVGTGLGGTGRAVAGRGLTGRGETGFAGHYENSKSSILESFSGVSRVLALWSAQLMALGLAALACLLLDRWTQGPFVSGAVDSGTSAVDGSGAWIASIDRPWIAAAWMFCLQGFWQLLPVPQSLGRVGWSSVIGLFANVDDDAASEIMRANHAVRSVRWGIIGFAVLTLVGGVIAIRASDISSQAGGRAFPAFAGITLLALWLVASTRGEDLFASQLTIAENGETGVMRARYGIGAILLRRKQRRVEKERLRLLRETAQRERSEATDAARADEILQRLHSDGPGSLSEEERQILGRVSEAIRRERERDAQ